MTKLLSEARAELFKDPYKGKPCPCCDKWVQAYKRRITSTTACALILLARHPQATLQWIHVEAYFAGLNVPNSRFKAALRGDFAKLAWWGLIEKMPGKRADGSDKNGHYRLTMDAYNFIHRRISLPKYAYEYNNELWGLSDGANGRPNEWVSIDQCLTKKFNYTELMQGVL